MEQHLASLAVRASLNQRCQSRFTPTVVWPTEDDLNILANGRRHQYLGKWKTTSIFSKWKKTTSVCFVNERLPQFLFNGRQPQLFYKWKTTSIVLQMKDNPKCVCKWKMTSDSCLNGRRPESCQLRLGNTLMPAWFTPTSCWLFSCDSSFM